MLPRIWTKQPPSGTAIAPEYLDGLRASFDGSLEPEFLRFVVNTATPLRVGRGSLAATTANDPCATGRGYFVTTSGTQALNCATTGAEPDTLVELPAGSWTFQCRIEGITGSGANPGFWRNEAIEAGQTFIVENGASRRPWVRVNSSDVLKPVSGPTWAAGQTIDLLIRYVNTKRCDAWWDGMQQHSATHSVSAAALTGSTAIYRIGRQNVTDYQIGTWSAVRFWDRALTDDQMRELSRNPWAFYAPAPRRLWVNSVAAANQTIAVPSGALTLTGYAPDVLTPNVVQVPAGSLTLSALAPNVDNPQGVAVPAGSLSLTGFAPTVSSSAAQTVQVPAASLTLTGYVPTVVNPQSVAVPAGSLTLTGYAPAIAVNQTIQVPAGSLTLTGFAPSVVATASNYLSIAAASLTLTAYAPAILGVQAAETGGGGRPWRRFEDLFGPRREPFAAPKKSATRKARAADRARIDAEFEHAALLADAQQDEEAAAQFERLRQDYATASAQLREHILQQARELERQQIERQRQALALAEQQQLNNVQQQRDRLKRAAALLMMMH